MSKNLTRKGLAFGALVALGASVIAGAPANAAGIDNTATLVPESGYAGAYAVPANAAATFTLKYTTTNVAGSTIKFKVTDPTGKIEPDATSVGRTGFTTVVTGAAGADTWTRAATGGLVTVTDGAGAAAGNLAVGDLINVTATNFTAATLRGVAAGVYEISAVAADGTTFSFNDGVTGAPTGLLGVAAEAIEVIREARAADNSYIIDTGIVTGAAANTRTANVVFKSLDAASYTRSAKVQGWTDDANLLNGAVDTSESLSAEREIQFVKVSEITATTTLLAPKVGDTALTAEITTSPVLNGAQLTNSTSAIGQSGAAAKDFIRALFTRQDSAVKIASDSAVQDADDGTWAASANLDVDTVDAVWTASDAAITAASGTASWGFTAPTDRSGTALTSIAITAAKVATVTTDDAHNLRTGDKVTVTVDSDESAVAAAAESIAVPVTVTSTKSFTYSLSDTAAVVAGSDTDVAVTAVFNAATGYVVATYASAPAYLVGRVFAGSHSAQALLNTTDADTDTAERYTLTGAASTLGTLAAVSSDIKMSTTGSATLQGSQTIEDDNTVDAYIKAGTLSAVVTATVVDVEGAAVGAGRSVAFTVERSAGTIKVNDKALSGSAITDASGQVTFTVTDTLGLSGSSVTINAVAEGVSTAASDITLTWATQAYALYDLAVSSADALATSSRTVVAGSSYDLNLLVADQWGAVAADADYRLRLTGSGVTEGFVNIVAGKATVKVTDTKVSTQIASTIALQKKGTTGVFADSSVVVLTTNTTDKGALTLGADGSALYAPVNTVVPVVDLSDAVAAKALVERDSRTSFTAVPAYDNDLVIAGKATNSSTGANLAYSVVTVSGPTSILFSKGAVDKRGGLTLISDGNGEFSVTLYSTTAQTDSVITVVANGASSTVKVSFTGIGVGEGTALVVTAPATALPASTFQISAKLTDTYGNAVTAAAGRIKVTHSGPGIVYGTLPTSTDANGALSFSVLLGAADVGNAVFTVSYDQNGDTDFVDAKDLTSAKTVVIGSASVLDVSASVAGTPGFVAVTVRNASGKAVTVTVNGRVLTPRAPNAAAQLYRFRAKAGKTTVVVKVDGVTVASRTVMVK